MTISRTTKLVLGALTALVLAKLPSTQLRFTYMALFSAGSIAGMGPSSCTMPTPVPEVAKKPAST